MYEKERRLVDAGAAKVVSIVSTPLLDTETLTLFWPLDDLKLASSAKEFLDKYTSTLNYNDGAPSNTVVMWVENPVATLMPLAGKWRRISNSLTQHNNVPGIVQVLRKGYLSKLPDREEIDDECLLAEDKIDPINGKRTITRYWFGVDPDKEKLVMDKLKLTTVVTDPHIRDNGESTNSEKVYTGRFAVSAIWPAIGSEDGDMRIYQTLTEVLVVDSMADLLLLTPLRTRENEILEPFGITSGEEDTYAFVFKNIDRSSRDYLIGVPDATLVTSIANIDASAWVTGTVYTIGQVVTQSSKLYICIEAHTAGTFATDLSAEKWEEFGTWTYVDRKFADVADNTGTFTVIFKNERWNAWGHNLYTADTTSYGDAGTANERESITKVWGNIKKADLATAISNCRTGTNVAAESGYIIIEARASDNHNGSVTLTQTQIKQINDKDEVGTEVLNAHGIFQGLGQTTRTVFENFTAATLPAGDTPAINTDVISNIAEIQGNGLWRRIVITKTVTWGKTWADAVKMEESNVGGYQLAEDRLAGGISAANSATAFTAAQTASAATRLVVMTRLMEKANGERMVANMERKITNSPTAIGVSTPDTVVAETVQIDRTPAICVRVWWRRTLAAKDYLVAVGGGARIAFTYNSVTYTHHDIRVHDNGDGSYDVYQTAKGGNYFTVGRFDNTGEVVEHAQEVLVRADSGSLDYSVRVRVVYRTLFDTAQAAADYAAAGAQVQSNAVKQAGTLIRLPPNGVEYAGGGKYWGRKVMYHRSTAEPDWTTITTPA